MALFNPLVALIHGTGHTGAARDLKNPKKIKRKQQFPMKSQHTGETIFTILLENSFIGLADQTNYFREAWSILPPTTLTQETEHIRRSEQLEEVWEREISIENNIPM